MYTVAHFFFALFVETPRAILWWIWHGWPDHPVDFNRAEVRRIKLWLKNRTIN